MSISHSEDYYFSGGDVVLQVRDTLFKLHRDILKRHSGFFEDMFSLPVAGTEGLDEGQPLHLPQDLCSLDVFKMICLFLYPKKIGSFPRVFVNDFNKWEPVLMGCEALQLSSIQEYLLSQLQINGGNVASEPVRLLYWSMRSEITAHMLALQCIQALAYRRRPLSETEIIRLGSKTTMQVMHVREKLRTVFVSQESFVNNLKIRGCGSQQTCPNVIAKWFTSNLSKVDASNRSDTSDIFKLPGAVPQSLCSACRANAAQTIRQLRWNGLDTMIHQWAREVGALSPASPYSAFGA